MEVYYALEHGGVGQQPPKVSIFTQSSKVKRWLLVVEKVKSPPPPLRERYEEVRHGHIDQG